MTIPGIQPLARDRQTRDEANGNTGRSGAKKTQAEKLKEWSEKTKKPNVDKEQQKMPPLRNMT